MNILEKIDKILNKGVEIFVKKPSECNKDEKKTFINKVVSGGQNVESYVKKEFKKLVFIGFLYDNGELKSVKAVKKERNHHIFELAGVEDQADDYPYEIGFAFTDNDVRGKGYSSLLHKEIFKKIGNIGTFATVRVNNTASINLLKKYGYKPLGKSYEGIETKVQLYVYKK